MIRNEIACTRSTVQRQQLSPHGSPYLLDIFALCLSRPYADSTTQYGFSRIFSTHHHSEMPSLWAHSSRNHRPATEPSSSSYATIRNSRGFIHGWLILERHEEEVDENLGKETPGEGKSFILNELSDTCSHFSATQNEANDLKAFIKFRRIRKYLTVKHPILENEMLSTISRETKVNILKDFLNYL